MNTPTPFASAAALQARSGTSLEACDELEAAHAGSPRYCPSQLLADFALLRAMAAASTPR